MKYNPINIIKNEPVTDGSFLLQFDAPWLAKSLPGQFVLIETQAQTTSPLLKLPLAVHDIEGNTISLLYCVTGPKTTLLSKKTKGEQLKILGPCGNGFTIEDQADRYVLVGGGCGVAPLFYLAKQLAKLNKDIDFFYGAKTRNQLVPTDKLSTLGINIHIATDDGSKGVKGFVTELLDTHLHMNEGCYIYASGPSPMLESVKATANKYNTKGQLTYESYMACGIGACLGCTVNTKDGYKLCCCDGPVFEI